MIQLTGDLKSIEAIDKQDLQTYLSATANKSQTLLNCKYEIHSKNQIQAVHSKLQNNTEITENDIEIIKAQMRSLKSLASEF